MFAQLASMDSQGCCRKQRAVLRVKLVIKLLHQEYTSIDGKPYRHTAVFKQSGQYQVFPTLIGRNECLPVLIIVQNHPNSSLTL